MRAVVTVIGKDAVGILAKVSAVCAKNNANVIEVTQSVLQDMFAMIMLVDITALNIPFAELADEIFTLLMGEEVDPRREWIEENAKYVVNLDI